MKGELAIPLILTAALATGCGLNGSKQEGNASWSKPVPCETSGPPTPDYPATLFTCPKTESTFRVTGKTVVVFTARDNNQKGLLLTLGQGKRAIYENNGCKAVVTVGEKPEAKESCLKVAT